jgi:hypothetical protein
LRARLVETGQVWAAAIAIPILLVAPAIWNGYPLLQWDTTTTASQARLDRNSATPAL